MVYTTYRMDNFYAFWDKINGPMYQDVPPPVKYDLQDYESQITNSTPLNNTETGTANLIPLNHEDMAQAAAEDVEEWIRKHGTNTTKLGPPMSDASFKKFMGQTWN